MTEDKNTWTVEAVGKAKKVIDKESLPGNIMSMDEALRKLLDGAPQGAVVLKGLRTRENFTQAKLGELLGIAQTNISQMERGRRAIGKDLAKRLAKFFETDYRLFL